MVGRVGYLLLPEGASHHAQRFRSHLSDVPTGGTRLPSLSPREEGAGSETFLLSDGLVSLPHTRPLVLLVRPVQNFDTLCVTWKKRSSGFVIWRCYDGGLRPTRRGPYHCLTCVSRVHDWDGETRAPPLVTRDVTEAFVIGANVGAKPGMFRRKTFGHFMLDFFPFGHLMLYSVSVQFRLPQ